MPKKLKNSAGGKGRKDDDDSKKKSDKEPNKKGKGKEKNSSPSPKAKSQPVSARKRWGKLIPFKAWDATLAKLQIQLNIEDKAEEPEPIPEIVKKKTYCVKKYEKILKRSEMKYAVCKRAQDDTDLVLWMPEKLDGLRFENGVPVTHSILGSIAEYLAEDSKLKHDEDSTSNRLDKTLPDIKSQKTGSYKLDYLGSYKVDQGKALETWEKELLERETLGEAIAFKSRRSKDDLLMGNHPYRVANGEFNDLESAWKSDIRATKSIGFWKQEERLGDDLRGIHITLTKTEQGATNDPETVFRPGSGRLNKSADILDLTVRNEKSSSVPDDKSLKFDPGSPVTSPIPSTPDIGTHEPIIALGDQILTWSNRDCEVDVELGIITAPGETKMGNLAVMNIGTCVIRYELLQIPKSENDIIPNRPIDKRELFVDESSGIVLPGDYQNISAIFHSREAAIFSERWRLITAPRLAKEIIITVWGIAKDQTELGQNGEEIEREIEAKCLAQFALNILEGIIDKMFYVLQPIRTEGFPMHVDPKWFKTIVGNELFSSVNPGLIYHSEPVAKIIQLAQISLPETTFDKWSLPLSTIRRSLLDLQEDVELINQVVSKNDVVESFMVYVRKLPYVVDVPVTNRKHDMCRGVLLDICNDICNSATRIKKVHGITIDMDFIIDLPKVESPPPPLLEPVMKPRPRTKTPPKSASKTKKKLTPRQISAPSSPTGSKSTRFGMIIQGISSAKKAQYKNRAKPIMYLKYLEKLNISTYITVKKYIDRISDILYDLPEVQKLRL